MNRPSTTEAEQESQNIIYEEEELSQEPMGEVPCQINIFSNKITGWDFSLVDCDLPKTGSYECILQCGLLPPQEVFDDEQRMCYETAGGFIDHNTEVPCRFDPVPPSDMSECIDLCLQEM